MQRRSRSLRAALYVLAASVIALPASGHAQGLLSAGLGAGGALGSRNSAQSGGDTHAVGYLQVHAPLFPIALRADALYAKNAFSGSSLAILGDAVLVAPIPFIHPYALVGYGKYGVGKPNAVSGWNAGVGVRLRVAGLGVFAEVRRHELIPHDLFTLGISF